MGECSDLPDYEGAVQNPIAKALDDAEVAHPRPLGPENEQPCDILPLGHAGGRYYFISRDGELREYSARELIRLNIASLFGGNTSWLCDNFPSFSKKGEKIHGAFNGNLSAEWLMRQCHVAGLFDAATPSRRLGVWRSRDDVVAHFGRNIWYRGHKQPAGCIVNGAIYPSCSPVREPDFANPADRYECDRLRQNFNAWNFTQDFDADLLFGFLGAALLGGFPKWRVHGLISGERGSGKTTIGEYVMNAIGAQGTSLNEYTEAGVRQSLTNESRVLHLDEGESGGEEQAHRMAKVIGLLRKMSDGVGARIVRGTSGGTAQNSTVTGCVLLTAINPPPLQPQDRSRILSVGIEKAGRATQDDIRLMCQYAADISPRLRARALIGANRFADTFRLYHACLLAHGCDARQADLFATLCAGRSLLLHDEIPARDIAERFVADLRFRLSLIMIDDSEAGDGQSCLNRLLDAECAAIRDGIKRSIGQLVSDAIGTLDSPENDKLVPLGLRILDVKGTHGMERVLFVANDHLGLRRIFHNTPWADGNWRSSLRRLAGVIVSPKPVGVGRKARGVLIPASLLPARDNDREVDLTPHPPDPAPGGF
ncbi:MAG: hypothetical protein KGI37_07670 [Alphaproteobacteria bacterium]|nr:hypothetical protein [Alphaproteobacteria bacterium]